MRRMIIEAASGRSKPGEGVGVNEEFGVMVV